MFLPFVPCPPCSSTTPLQIHGAHPLPLPPSSATTKLACGWMSLTCSSPFRCLYKHKHNPQALLFYDLPVMAFKNLSAVAHDVFSATQTSKGWGGANNFIQLRLEVDGVPYRQSSCHGSVGALNEVSLVSLSGYLILDALPPTAANGSGGNHIVKLQWKMQGPHVLSWSNVPSAADGFRQGRSLNIRLIPPLQTSNSSSISNNSSSKARIRMWGVQPLTPTKLSVVNQQQQEQPWNQVAGMSFSFTLTESMLLRILYVVVVRADQARVATDPHHPRDDVAARLVVDGAPFRESSSSLALICLVSCGGLLEGGLVLPELAPGPHNVSLEWKKHGSLTYAWRNDPTLLDGYAASPVSCCNGCWGLAFFAELAVP